MLKNISTCGFLLLYILLHHVYLYFVPYCLHSVLMLSLPGPCMCLGASPVCCSTMCLFTDPPAARPSWQRRAVWRPGQGFAAFGAEAAVSPGNPAWLMEASFLPYSAPLKLVRKTSQPFYILVRALISGLSFPDLPNIERWSTFVCRVNILQKLRVSK